MKVLPPAGPPEARTFEEFWLAYLKAHRRVETRVVHYGAALCGVLAMALGVMTANVWNVVGCLVLSYGLGALAHVLFEKNRIVVEGRPLWSLACCYRMAFSALTGHLSEDLARTKGK